MCDVQLKYTSYFQKKTSVHAYSKKWKLLKSLMNLKSQLQFRSSLYYFLQIMESQNMNDAKDEKKTSTEIVSQLTFSVIAGWLRVSLVIDP